MLRAGLAGGVASGKSALAALLAELGAAVCDADALVGELYRPGGAGAAAADRLFGRTVLAPDGGVDRARLADVVLPDPEARRRLEAAVHPLVGELYRPGGAGAAAADRLFGRTVLAPDGGVDRARLADIVLPDPEARRRLEAAVHPLVRAGVARWLQGLASAGRPPQVAVVEAALLVETGAFRDYDRLVVVAAPEALRLGRALARGWPETKFRLIAAAQAADEERTAAADYVVRNDGSRPELAAAAQRLWALLVEDARRLEEGAPLPARRLTV